MAERRGLIRERVLRVLLNNPSGTLSKYRIAKECGGSYPWVHELLGKLEGEGLLEGTRVKDFKGLATRWQEWRVEPGTRGYMLRKPLEVLSRSDLKYALTTYQAENLVQNYLFPSRVDFYIGSDRSPKVAQPSYEGGARRKGEHSGSDRGHPGLLRGFGEEWP